MKKFLFFALFAILMACTEDNSIGNISDETNNTALKEAGDAKYDLLGHGYDITGEYLHVNSSRLQVINVKNFIRDYPELYRYPTTVTLDSKEYAGATADDFLDEIISKNQITLGRSGKILGISLKSNLKGVIDIEKKHTYSTKYSFARVDIIKRIKKLELETDINTLIPYLNTSFINSITTDSPEAIVKKYGTHVLLSITIGGRMQFTYKSAIEENMSHEDKKLVVEAGASFQAGKFGADFKNRHEIQSVKNRNNKNASWDISVQAHGGEVSGMSTTYNSETGYPTLTFDRSAWERSVNNSNAALVEVNWEKAYPIYDFVTDPIKKGQIKTAVEHHINNKNLEILKVCPLYRYWNNSDKKDHLYSIIRDDITYGRSDYVYEWIQGYVHPTQISGTVPLYRYWNNTDKKDHFYTIIRDDVTYARSGYVYETIEGYIYKNQVPGTVPLYRYWNNSDRMDHFYTTNWNELGYGRLNYVFEGIEGYIYPRDDFKGY